MSKASDDPNEIRVMKDPRLHILQRPDMYCGSVVFGKKKTYVAEDEKIFMKTISTNPAFERLIIEVGSNCIDNVWRSQEAKKPCKFIDITADLKTGLISFRNDGLTIPLTKNRDLPNLWNPTVTFGIYQSSSNYNDNQDRKTSGKNGYGVKLTNTFSKLFKIEISDGQNVFKQEWSGNMEHSTKPVIEKKKGQAYTLVQWIFDYPRFGLKGLTKDLISAIRKYAIDIALIAGVNVHFNGENISKNTLESYARLYSPFEESCSFHGNETSLLVFPLPEPTQKPLVISFVNGIQTFEGGVHVDYWTKAILVPLLEKLNGENSKTLKMKDINCHFGFVILCSLTRPEFTSQEKVKLTAPKPKEKLKAPFTNRISKWSVFGKLKKILEDRQLQTFKKELEGPRTRYKNIPMFDDANLAGTKRSSECTLLYFEGLSAKTYCLAGIEKGINGKSGRDFFGLLPCGGKILNVRKADAEKITANIRVKYLIQALGLELGLDYTLEENFKRLRYGTFMIVPDADSDGIHIEGLCQNFIHRLYPSLLKRNPSFIATMKTPIVRVKMKDSTEQKFYRVEDFFTFKDAHKKDFKSKPMYFKGLGSSNTDQTIDSFGERVIYYINDEDASKEMEKAFAKGSENMRKEWSVGYDSSNVFTMPSEEKAFTMNISDFINRDLVEFSVASNERAIPSIVDGLKESQRKIVFGVRSLKLKAPMKTARLASLIAAKTEYAHGEAILANTVYGLAWDFVGSNNIALMQKDGGFGSRSQYGKDGADPRYTFTMFRKIVPFIFREEDEPILNYIEGEDQMIEPEFLVPIIPMILVNGVRGAIGMGYSSLVPAYNPKDILRALRIWIEGNLFDLPKDGRVIFSDLPELTPWYHGFKGIIEKVSEGKFRTKGILTKIDEKTYHVSELPIRRSTEFFHQVLKDQRQEGIIDKFTIHSSVTRINDTIIATKKEPTLSSLKMILSISATNMVAFNEEKKICKYDTVDEIIYEFCKVRLKYYEKRKAYDISDGEKKHVKISAQLRFVEAIINGSLVIARKPKDVVRALLEEEKYPMIDDSHDYLLKMPIDSFTEERLESLRRLLKKTEDDLHACRTTPCRKTWLKELDEFEKAYDAYLRDWKIDEEKLNRNKKNRK